MENRIRRKRKYDYEKIRSGFLYVIAKDTIRLDGLLEQVNNDLIIKKFEGTIVFDMLIVNGNNKRRYFQSFADNNGVIVKSLSTLDFVPAEIIDISNNYIKDHIGVLEHGVLSRYEINKIKESLLA